MRIAYLHGLNSNNLGQKNSWLKTISEVFDPMINYTDENIYQKLKSQIITFNSDLIIGSSMGGYFGYEICKELNIHAILFNPALHSRSLEPDMTGQIKGEYKPNIHFVFGENDTLINPKSSMKIIENENFNNKTYSILNHGHDTPLEVFRNEILKFIKNK